MFTILSMGVTTGTVLPAYPKIDSHNAAPDNGLADAVSQQAITWSNMDSDLRRGSLRGQNVVKKVLPPLSELDVTHRNRRNGDNKTLNSAINDVYISQILNKWKHNWLLSSTPEANVLILTRAYTEWWLRVYRLYSSVNHECRILIMINFR